MSVKRYKTLYPDSIFRAQIIFKNIAPSDEKWAEGVLCRDADGTHFIVGGNSDAYLMHPVYIDTLGMASGFKDGRSVRIFEGDIVSVSRFSGICADESIEEMHEMYAAGGEEFKKRTVFADVPDGADEEFNIRGVVFMNGGMFYVQYFSESDNCLTAAPLYPYFGFDMLPAGGMAVKVIGNMYDDEELYSQVLRISHDEMM